MKKQLMIVGIMLVLIVVGLSGCTDEDALSGLGYRNTEFGFGLNPPEGWTVEEIPGGYDLIVGFLGPTEENYQVSMTVFNFTLDVEETIKNSTERITEPFIGDPNFTLDLSNERTVNGMNAYEIAYTANLIKQKMVAVEKNELVLLLLYSALVSTYDNYLPVFEESVNSLVIE